ncbi:MAG: glycosyltransferase family 25 protein [Bacteroidota bacterium]
MANDITVFIVSLKNSTDRRAQLAKHLEHIGLKFEWFDATYGKSLTDEEMAQYCDLEAIKENPVWLSRSAIGCALSHYFIYKEVIRRNLPYALILEDDIVFEKDFIPYIDTVAKQLQKNEIAALYYQSWDPIRLIGSTVVDIHKPYKSYIPQDIYQPISTAGYIITKDACKTFSEAMIPLRRTADSWGQYKQIGAFENFRCVYPRPVDTVDAKSTIEYIGDNWKSRLMQWVDKNKIFPLYQILRKKRNLNRQSMMKAEIIDK